MDKVLSLLGLARRAGHLKSGEVQTGSAARAGRARAIFLASDASGNARRRAEGFAGSGGAALVALPQPKEELSRAVGGNTCAMVAVTDLGLALRIVTELCAAYPGQYNGIETFLRRRMEASDLKKRRAGTGTLGSGQDKRRNSDEQSH